MAKISQKQREILARENLILEAARPMLIQEGYHGLNMDRIAELLQYSKGTIYNHFGCKEEIIIALAIITLKKRTELFELAAAFKGTTRERMLAIGMANDTFVRRNSDHIEVEQMIRTATIWNKTTEKRRMTMIACEGKCIGIVSGIVRDAIAQGDLELDSDTRPEDLVFGLWSMSYGAYGIVLSSDSPLELGRSQPELLLRRNQTKLIDGYGWKPLSCDFDYEAAAHRIDEELFSNEFQSNRG